MATAKLIFNEAELMNRLAALSCSKMVAFSAACAERLMPVYARYAEKAVLNAEDRTFYRNALDVIWSQVLSRENGAKSLEELASKCLNSIPSEDDAWKFGEPYAEDAGAAVTFAIKAWLSHDPNDAVWAARRLYDAVDNFVTCANKENYFVPIDEQQILAHPLMQKELARQRYDLEQLEAETEPSVEQELVKELRARSQKDALTVFVQ